MDMIWDRGENKVAEWAEAHPAPASPFHHPLVAAGLFSWVALQLPLMVTDGLGTGDAVFLVVIRNKALLAFFQKLTS